MNRSGPRISVDLEIPFHDVDMLGIVWHGHYYKYLEIARTALMRSVDLEANDLIGPVYRFLVIETRCRYTSPLHYGDTIRIAAWFSDTRHRLCISYELQNMTRKRRAAKAQTILATTDAAGRLLMLTPTEIQERAALQSPKPT